MIKDSQLYNDYEKLDKPRLIEIIQGQQKVIQAYLNRSEKLDEWLNKFDNKCCDDVLTKINRIALEFPVVGKE